MAKSALRPIQLPTHGMHTAKAYENQPSKTSVDMRNCRAFDPVSERERLSQRAGLKAYTPGAAASEPVVGLIQGTAMSSSAPSLSVAAVRTTVNLAVCAGSVYKFTTSGFSTATGGSAAFPSTYPVIYAAQLYDGIYFACDGVEYKYYSIDSDSVSVWETGDATWPIPTGCRLICRWDGRIVMAGREADPHNWYASRKTSATNFNFSPDVSTDLQATGGSYADCGLIGDVVTALVPYSDDVLIFGCDHTIYQLSGNPSAGGQLDLISDNLGMAWGRPFTRDPSGVLYFFGSRGGIYRMTPGSVPEPMSDSVLPSELRNIDLTNILVQLAWDDERYGLHIFLTDLQDQTASVHYFWDQRKNGFFADSFGNHDHNPRSVCQLDADDPDDRVLVFGGRDGKIRYFDGSTTDDDGTAIISYAWIGPFNKPTGEVLQMRELTATLGQDSHGVTWEAFSGQTAEEALDDEFSFDGIWSAGANPSDRQRLSGAAIYLKISNFEDAERWSIERINANLIEIPGLGNLLYE